MIDFRDYLSIDSFEETYELWNRAWRVEPDDREDALGAFIVSLDKALTEPIKRFLTAKSDAGELRRPENGKGLRPLLAVYYCSVIDDPREAWPAAWDSLCHWFRRAVMDRILMMNPNSPTLDESYKATCDMFTNGSFVRIINEFEECRATGRRVRLDFEPGWKAVITEILEDGTMIKAFDAELLSVQSMPFVVERGQVLCNDWFRIPGFTEHFRNDEEGSIRFNVNTIPGTINTTLHHMERGAVHVYVGNSSPSAYETEDGSIVFGYASEEEKDGTLREGETPESLGFVCTDLWWVTMIERHKLEEILRPVHGDDTERLIEEHGTDLVIDLEPGTYDVRFHGAPKLFMEEFDPDAFGVKLGMIDEPYFVIKKRD